MMDSAEPMLDCEAVMKQLWDYLDGELTPDRLKVIEAHVQLCQACTPHVEFERAFLEALRVARAHQAVDASLRDRVLGRLRSMGYSA